MYFHGCLNRGISLACSLCGVTLALATPTFRDLGSAPGRAAEHATHAATAGDSLSAHDLLDGPHVEPHVPLAAATSDAGLLDVDLPASLYRQSYGASAGSGPRASTCSSRPHDRQLHALPPPPSSLALALTALAGFGTLHAGRSIRKIHLSQLPDWYHAECVRQVGHATPLELTATGALVRRPLLPINSLCIQDSIATDEGPRRSQCLPFLRASACRCALDLVRQLTAARPPPAWLASLPAATTCDRGCAKRCDVFPKVT